jgi:hypothetical protein
MGFSASSPLAAILSNSRRGTMTLHFAKPLYSLAVLAGLFLSVASAAAQSSLPTGKELQGTWKVEVTQRDCNTGDPLGTPFQSLLTFNSAGTMTETTDNPMFFPAERGPGHGVWSFKGGTRYSAATIAFVTLNGALTKTQIIRQTIEMGDDLNRFNTVKATVQFFDPTGKLLVTGCATATGVRFR